MRVVVISTQELLPHFFKVIRSDIEIAAILLVDISLFNNGTLNIEGKKYTAFSYDYLPECLNEMYYDYILLNIPPYYSGGGHTSVDAIAIEDIDRLGQEKKLFHMGVIYTYMFNMFPLLFKYIARDIEKYRVFITGDSTPWRGTDLNCFEVPALNISYSSQDLYYDYLLSKKLLEIPENKFKCAILGITPWIFNSDISISTTEKHNLLFYYRMFKDVHNYHISAEVIEEMFNPDLFTDDNLSVPEGFDLDTFSGRYAEQALQLADRMKVRKKFSVWQHKRYSETVKENIFILKKFLELLKKHSVTPLLIRYPLTDACREFFPKYPINEGDYIINSLRKKYDFQYLDQSDFPGLNYSDFFDAYHLNARGAKKFSAFLNDFIKGLS